MADLFEGIETEFIEAPEERPPGDPTFAPRTIRVSDIKGFEGEERTDSIIENIGLDMKEIVQSYGFLAKALAENPLDTFTAIGKNLGPAMVESYTRWYDAAQNDLLFEAIAAHPLQALQDLTLPISLIASGGATGLGLAGKGAGATAKALRSVAKISDIAGIASDPISGVAVVGARKIGGKVMQRAVGKSTDELQGAVAKVIEDVPDVDLKAEVLSTAPISREKLIDGFLADGTPNAAERASDIIKGATKGEPFIVPGLDEVDNAFANEVFKANPAEMPSGSRIIDNLKIENIDTPEALKKVEDFLTDKFSEQVDKARQTISIEEINTAAGRARFVANHTGLSEVDVLKKVSPEFKETSSAKLVVRGLINDEARREALYQAKRIMSGQNADMDVMKFNIAVDRFVNTSNALLGEASEAGRALRILREIPKKQRLTDKALNEVIDLTGGRNQSQKLAKEMLAIGEQGLEPEIVRKGQARMARGSREATTWDKAMEVWINGLLSGVQTQAVNMIGNTATSMFAQAENFIAAGVSKVPILGSGRITFNQAIAEIEGMAKGFSTAARRGFQAFIAETSPDVLGKTELVPRKAIGGKVGKVVRLPGSALQGADVFWKLMNADGKMGSLAEREAQRLIDTRTITKGEKALVKKELLANPPQDLWEEALKAGRERTFTNAFKDNWLGDLGTWVNKGQQKIPLLKLAMPFVKTPTNIANFAIERTPLAFTLRDVRKVLLGPKSVERDLAWSKLMMGTAVGWTSAWAANNGIITGGAPSDKKERQILEATGWQEYSIKVGDNYLSYGRIEPLGMIMGISADMNRLSDLMVEGEMDDTAAAISGAVFKNFSSKTFMKGLNDVVRAMNEPDKYAAQWWQNMAASSVPYSSLIASGARAVDPVFRETDSVFERAQARGVRMFGSKEDLPPRRNIWGDELKIEEFKFLDVDPDDTVKVNSLINGALRFINPIYMKSDKNDKVTNFMVAMDYFPGLPSRRKGGIELKTREWSRYIELAGKPAKELLDKRAGSNEWDQIIKGTNDDRLDLVDFIDSVVKNYREDAWDQLLREFPDIDRRMTKTRDDKLRKLQEL
jgi:hypothetical protein